MDDLIAFVRAQLDEDKRRAMEAGHDTEDLWRHWIVSGDEDVMVRDANAWVAVGPYGGSVGDAAAHIARHDPARELREVESKRRILDLHPHRRFATLPDRWPERWRAETRQAFPGTDQPYVGCEHCDWDYRFEIVEPDWWCETVRLLVEPYAGRPGYKEEWRP